MRLRVEKKGAICSLTRVCRKLFDVWYKSFLKPPNAQKSSPSSYKFIIGRVRVWMCVVQKRGPSLLSRWGQHRVHKDSTKSRRQKLKEGNVLGSAGIMQVHVDSRALGSVWKWLTLLHLVFGGRGPWLTFGLHGVRTSPHAKSQWALTGQMRTEHCPETTVQTDWLDQRAGKEPAERTAQGGRRGRSACWRRFPWSSSLPQSLCFSKQMLSYTALSVPRACYVPASNKALINVCWTNKLMEMFLHIKHDMLLKNSICAQLCRCASIVGYFNYIQLFLCSVYEVDCGSNIIKLIREAS